MGESTAPFGENEKGRPAPEKILELTTASPSDFFTHISPCFALSNTRVIRWGSDKLGTSGMVRAYSLAAKNVIAEAETLPYVKEIKYAFETPYNEVDRMLYRLKQLEITRPDGSF